jgi:hypothetical protein
MELPENIIAMVNAQNERDEEARKEMATTDDAPVEQYAATAEVVSVLGARLVVQLAMSNQATTFGKVCKSLAVTAANEAEENAWNMLAITPRMLAFSVAQALALREMYQQNAL